MRAKNGFKFTIGSKGYNLSWDNIQFTLEYLVGSKKEYAYFGRVEHALNYILSLAMKQSTAGSMHEFIEDVSGAVKLVKALTKHVDSMFKEDEAKP